jgi:hypothetical protein
MGIKRQLGVELIREGVASGDVDRSAGWDCHGLARNLVSAERHERALRLR